jgi:potassium channel subfamily K
VAFTTIGYGEVTPATPAGRAFFIIWAVSLRFDILRRTWKPTAVRRSSQTDVVQIFGVATVTLLIAVLTEAYADRYRRVTVNPKSRHADRERAREEDKEKEALESAGKDEQKGNDDVARILREGRATGGMEGCAREVGDVWWSADEEILNVVDTWHKHVTALRHMHADSKERGGLAWAENRGGESGEGAGAGEAGRGSDSAEEREVFGLLRRMVQEQDLSDEQKEELIRDQEVRERMIWSGYEREWFPAMIGVGRLMLGGAVQDLVTAARKQVEVRGTTESQGLGGGIRRDSNVVESNTAVDS